MKKSGPYFSALFLTRRFYYLAAACIFFFVARFFFPVLGNLPWFLLEFFLLWVMIDYIILIFLSKKIQAQRITPERFSNGDDNPVELIFTNPNAYGLHIEVIDELPFQFQERDWKKSIYLQGGKTEHIRYSLRPTERGEYHFGYLLLFLKTAIGLLSRRQRELEPVMVPVYPAFLQLKKYSLLSRTTLREESGTKRMRKIGHSMEFEQIRDYVRGDDIRTMNWKASARKGGMMINTFTDEKSQQVYIIIDKGRLMKMPFNGLALIDYAINSALILGNVCLQKQDRVGLVTFSNKLATVLAADKKPIQRMNMLNMLYNQKTAFLESDFEMLYMQLRNRIKSRSLLILYTNFESLSGLKRQLPYLRSLSRHHLLMVVFFENIELTALSKKPAHSLEEVYIKTIAEKFSFEKRLIVKELMKHGILSVLTSPENLTVNTVNKYLELKARQAL